MDLNTFFSSPGSAVELARAIKVSPSLISQWKTGFRPIPAERCPAIERATNGAVRCEDLRPDVDWGVLRGASTAPKATQSTSPAATAQEVSHG